jgi:hypothetical protein
LHAAAAAAAAARLNDEDHHEEQRMNVLRGADEELLHYIQD